MTITISASRAAADTAFRSFSRRSGTIGITCGSAPHRRRYAAITVLLKSTMFPRAKGARGATISVPEGITATRGRASTATSVTPPASSAPRSGGCSA